MCLIHDHVTGTLKNVLILQVYCMAKKTEYFQITLPKRTRLMSQASIIKMLCFRPKFRVFSHLVCIS